MLISKIITCPCTHCPTIVMTTELLANTMYTILNNNNLAMSRIPFDLLYILVRNSKTTLSKYVVPKIKE